MVEYSRHERKRKRVSSTLLNRKLIVLLDADTDIGADAGDSNGNGNDNDDDGDDDSITSICRQKSLLFFFRAFPVAIRSSAPLDLQLAAAQTLACFALALCADLQRLGGKLECMEYSRTIDESAHAATVHLFSLLLSGELRTDSYRASK